MVNSLKLLCVLAHPDDESLGTGGTVAKYSAEGVQTHLICATRGERGWFGPEAENPGLEALGRLREAELANAAMALGIREVHFLGYIDGDLDRAEPAEAIGRIAEHIRRIRPQVVITFDPNGAYGHPDHIAICQFTTAAVAVVPDTVQKLYYMAWPKAKYQAYESVFGELTMHVDEVTRRTTPWPDWAITTVVETGDYWPTVWKAVSCHKTQLAAYGQLEHLSEEHHRGLWGTQEYYRALSLVNGGRRRETDLFDGLR